MKKKIFELKEAHIKLAKGMIVDWDDCEFGAPTINCKRPYGNSAAVEDILKIIGVPLKRDKNEEIIEPLYDFAVELHKEMETALQIILSAKTFEPGTYEADEYGFVWKLSK